MMKIARRLRDLLPNSQSQRSDRPDDGVNIHCYSKTQAGVTVIPKCTQVNLLPDPTIVTCEDVCFEIGEQLRISPAALHLFSLCIVSNDAVPTCIWLSPDEDIIKHKHENIYFQCRYFPRDCRKLQALDPKSTEYLYWQMQSAYLGGRLEVMDPSVSLGVSVLCCCAALRLNTELRSINGNIANEDLNTFLKHTEISDFIPESLQDKNLVFKSYRQTNPMKEKIQKFMISNPPATTSAVDLMTSFLKHVLEINMRCYRETYTASLQVEAASGTITSGGGKKSVSHMTQVQVEINMDGCDACITARPLETTAPGGNMKLSVKMLYSLVMSREKDSGVDRWKVSIDGQNGPPQMWYFQREIEAKSFMSCLDGYYRLTVDYYRGLCSVGPLCHMAKLQKLRVFGPVSRRYISHKLQLQGSQEAYILRESLTTYNEYEVAYNRDSVLQLVLLGKVERSSQGYRMEGEDGDWSASLQQCIYNAIQSRPSIANRRRLNPQTDVCDRLLEIVQPGDQTSEADGTENEVTSSLPLVYPSNRVQVNSVVVGRGSFTEVLDAVIDREHFVVKRLRSDIPETFSKYKCVEALQTGMDRLLTEFHRKANEGTKHFVRLTGIVLASPILFIQPKAEFGCLEGFLQRRQSDQPLYLSHLINVVFQLASALLYLEELNSHHGNIHCGNVLVVRYDDHTMGVKLGDPGLVSFYNQLPLHLDINKKRIPSIAPEMFESFERASIKSDVYAYSTCLWQMFAHGSHPCDITQPLHGWTSSQMVDFYGSGQKLACPPFLEKKPDDPYEIEEIKTEMFQLMTECWQLDAEERLSAQQLVRTLNTQTASYDVQALQIPMPVTSAANQAPPPISATTHMPTTTTIADGFVRTSPVSTPTSPRNNADRREPVASISPGLETRPPFPIATGVSVELVVASVRHLIPETRLTLDHSQTGILGKGHYGVVYRGEMRSLGLGRTQDVAIKVMKPVIKAKYDKLLRQEIGVNEKLDHGNIVKFYGVSRGGEYIVMEYMPNGALIKYLDSHARDKISPLRMLGFCMDVAKGMEYLSSQNVIHCDLAARNVLLTSDLTAKVSDFGLSKVLSEEKDYYRRPKDNRTIPIFWCAPEWLGFELRYLTTSDVWSFGIVMWECYSYGRKPNICATISDFYKKGYYMLSQGKRLEKPADCPAEVYRLMLHCWEWESDRRPAFTQCLDRYYQKLGLKPQVLADITPPV